MSASIQVLRLNIGRFVSHQFIRRTATPSRQLCLGLRPSVAHTLVNRRLYSVEGAKNGDRVDQESDSFGGHQDKSDARTDQEAMDEEEEYEHSIRQRILTASLNHVLEHGWTQQAIEAGAQDEGLSAVAHGMFERGGVEIVNHFYQKCNTELAEYLKQEVERMKAEGLDKPKVRPFIQHAVETRLKMIVPYHSIWKQAMGIQTLPQNAPGSWLNLSNLVDDIWYYAGDRSTDFDWYTKRFSLAAVYKTTEIHMLQDTSPDFQDTWVFLDNRLNDLKNLASAKRALEPLKEGILGLCTMGRNMAGMNTRNR